MNFPMVLSRSTYSATIVTVKIVINYDGYLNKFTLGPENSAPPTGQTQDQS